MLLSISVNKYIEIINDNRRNFRIVSKIYSTMSNQIVLIYGNIANIQMQFRIITKYNRYNYLILIKLKIER